jgi:Tfp pilus assembly protein PilO
MTSREKSDFTKWITLLIFVMGVFGGIAGFGVARGLELAEAKETKERTLKNEASIHDIELANNGTSKDIDYIKESLKDIKQALGVKP